MQGKENERGVENVRKKARSARSPNTHNPQDWGQNPRKLYSECAQGPVLPTSEGCWRRKAPRLGWSQSQQLAQSAVGCWVRLAAAGPAQQSRGASLHLRSAGRRGLALRPLSVRAGLAETALGSEGRGRAWPGPGTAATSFLPSEAVSSSAPGLSTVCCPPLQRALSGAASGDQLACLTSLPSGRKISGKYRPARTIRRAGTGEEQRRGSVLGSDSGRIPGFLKGPGDSHWSRERGDRSSPPITSQIHQHLFCLWKSLGPGVTPQQKDLNPDTPSPRLNCNSLNT
ncbi:uncharacterized protein LOC134761095 [Pongo abelii]|uniref:uncharacterized protein LOC134761095 n=1 Tax=Pongo abelii TaxID=9601 RepID=UPI0030052F1B